MRWAGFFAHACTTVDGNPSDNPNRKLRTALNASNSNMPRVAIVAALPGELKPLVKGWRHERRNGVDLWHERFAGDDGACIAACAGMGVDRASAAFTAVETFGAVHAAISVGWAGALRPYMEPGLAACVREVVDAKTGERFETADWAEDLRLVTSPIVADETEKKRLAETYQAALVDMEAAGIARLAEMRGIPFYCIKGISDGAEEKLPDFTPFISPSGQLQAARFILHVLIRPSYWPALMRMGENSKRAAENIAERVRSLLDRTGCVELHYGK
jgi:adenosylhomocysteine nucleosidase